VDPEELGSKVHRHEILKFMIKLRETLKHLKRDSWSSSEIQTKYLPSTS